MAEFLAELMGWAVVGWLIIFAFRINVWTEIPIGREGASTVPMLNLFTVGWNAQQFGQSTYWHAPIFYPQAGTFAFSETQSTSVIVSPLWRLSPALAYNVYLLFHVGLATALLRRWVKTVWNSQAASFIAAGGLLLLPFLHSELGVLQLTALWGPIGVFWSFEKLVSNPTARTGTLLGLAFAGCYLSCHNYGFMVALIMLPRTLLWLLKPGRMAEQAVSRKRQAVVSGIIFAVAVPLVWPVVSAQREWLTEQKPRSLKTIERLSCRPVDWLFNNSSASEIARRTFQPDNTTPGFPVGSSFALTLLAAAGTLASWRRTQQSTQRRHLRFCCLLLSASVLLSLGPRLQIFGWSPYAAAVDWAPVLAYFRTPFRFAVFGQLAVVMLAAGGTAWWLQAASRSAVWKRFLLAALLLMALVESVPWQSRIHNVAAVFVQPVWVDWTKGNLPPDAAIACLPFPIDGDIQAFEASATAMLFTLQHHRPMVGGYSGFFPSSFRQLQQAMSQFPNTNSLNELRQRNVQLLVVPTADSAALSDRPEVAWVFSDAEADVVLFQFVDDPTN